MSSLQHNFSVNSSPQVILRSLADLKQGEIAQVVSIRNTASETGAALSALGISPNAYVRMVENIGHHIIIQVNHRKIAAEKAVAMEIIVREVG